MLAPDHLEMERIGSDRCIEGLRSDILGVQAGLKELLGRAGELQAPSWRFPERLATSLDTEALLKDASGPPPGEPQTSKTESYSTHVLLLELLVDRLLLLLQCSLRFTEQDTGHRPSSTPLTITSTVKKFTRRVQRDTQSSQELKKEVATKDARLSAMESTVSKLQEDCRLLRETLHNTIPTVHFSARPSTSELSGGSNDRLLATSRPTSSCVPYEALDTLRMNRLNTASGSRRISVARDEENGDSGERWATSASLMSLVGGPAKEETMAPPTCPGGRGVNTSTQTVETAFALCVRCSETQKCLVSIASSISQLCSECGRESILAGTDWKSLVDIGGLRVAEWEGALGRDLDTLKGYNHELKEKCRLLTSEIYEHQETIEVLQAGSKLLSSELSELQASISEVERRGESSLAETRRELSAKLTSLEKARESAEEGGRRMREALNAARQKEAQLRSMVANLEHKRDCLQSELMSLQANQDQLLSAATKQEGELASLSAETESLREETEKQSVELKKTRTHNHTLQKKNKSLQSRQSGLLARVEELDQECEGFHLALEKAISSREEVVGEMNRMQAQCSDLQATLEDQQRKLSESSQECERLTSLISHLESQLGEVQLQLEKETKNCRLLMDYPFVKQSSNGYGAHLASLTGEHSQRQVSANTVRILLLEEQNTELRHNMIQTAQTHAKGQKSIQLKQPTPLWQSELLHNAAEELAVPSNAPAVTAHPLPSSTPAITSLTAHPLPSSTPAITSLTAHPLPSSTPVQLPSEGHRKSHSAKPSTMPHTASSKDFIPLSTSTRPSSTQVPNEPQRPISSSQLRGRLGHLVSAIADAHRADHACRARMNNGQVQPLVVPSSSPCERQEAWMVSTTSESLDIDQGSPGSSYGGIKVLMCSNCDRMFHSNVELEKHRQYCSH